MTFSMRRASFTVTTHLLIFTSWHLEIGKKTFLYYSLQPLPVRGTGARKLQAIDFCRSIGIEWGI